MRLSARQSALLTAVAAGDVLKVHRTADGEKVYRLHPLDGAPPQEVNASDVEALERNGLVASNMKFPAATFLITELGFLRARRNNRVRRYSGTRRNQPEETTGTQVSPTNAD